MNDIICVSGGFDPLHAGHLEMFRQAASHGPLTVILNSDAWLTRKKGFVFLPWDQRAAIIGDLRHVHKVVLVADEDGTVCEALRRIRPRYFANGGDRKLDNTPETALCDELGIELLWNIGGEKSESSSEIATRAWVMRPWGGYLTLDDSPGYKVKKLLVEAGKSISPQYHQHRRELLYVVHGCAEINLDGTAFKIEHGEAPVIVEHGMQHQISNPTRQPLVIIEVQSGDYLGEDDIFRLASPYAANS